METFCEFAVVVGVDFKGGEVEADGGGVADGGCTAHLQLTDGRPDFALCFEMEVLGAVREFRLVDDDEGARCRRGRRFPWRGCLCSLCASFRIMDVPSPPQAAALLTCPRSKPKGHS